MNVLSGGRGRPTRCRKPLRILAIKRESPGGLWPGGSREPGGRSFRDREGTQPGLEPETGRLTATTPHSGPAMRGILDPVDRHLRLADLGRGGIAAAAPKLSSLKRACPDLAIDASSSLSGLKKWAEDELTDTRSKLTHSLRAVRKRNPRSRSEKCSAACRRCAAIACSTTDLFASRIADRASRAAARCPLQPSFTCSCFVPSAAASGTGVVRGTDSRDARQQTATQRTMSSIDPTRASLPPAPLFASLGSGDLRPL